jgi:hypothetical protein
MSSVLTGQADLEEDRREGHGFDEEVASEYYCGLWGLRRKQETIWRQWGLARGKDRSQEAMKLGSGSRPDSQEGLRLAT